MLYNSQHRARVGSGASTIIKSCHAGEPDLQGLAFPPAPCLKSGEYKSPFILEGQHPLLFAMCLSRLSCLGTTNASHSFAGFGHHNTPFQKTSSRSKRSGF
jgi:hypothetical protein